MFDSLLDVHSDAVKLAPYKSGTLRRSLNSLVSQNGKQLEGAVGSNLVYARIQELGGDTGRNHKTHITGKFYLTGAVEKNKDKIAKRFKDYLAIKRLT